MEHIVLVDFRGVRNRKKEAAKDDFVSIVELVENRYHNHEMTLNLETISLYVFFPSSNWLALDLACF